MQLLVVQGVNVFRTSSSMVVPSADALVAQNKRPIKCLKVLFNFVQIVDSVGAAIKVEWPRGCESETVPPPPRVPH